jgi:hypothetical protein
MAGTCGSYNAKFEFRKDRSDLNTKVFEASETRFVLDLALDKYK